jgi:hypothetical protein
MAKTSSKSGNLGSESGGSSPTSSMLQSAQMVIPQDIRLYTLGRSLCLEFNFNIANSEKKGNVVR